MANFLEAVLKGSVRFVIGKTQRIQQVRHGEKQGGDAQIDHKICRCCCQVGFSAAVISLENQPAIQGPGKAVGMIVGSFQGISLGSAEADLSPGLKIIKGQMAEFIQVAHPVQVSLHVLFQLSNPAGAGINLSEFRIADRQIPPVIA